MNIYQRIAEIQKTCSHVATDTRVNDQYDAVSHDGVLTVVRDSLIANGVVVLVSQQAKGFCHDGETKNGVYQVRFEAVYDITFVNIEKPEDRFTVAVEGHGEDFNDKGPGKAISYATKTAFLKTFLMVTGESDELRTGEGKPKTKQRATSPPASSGGTKPTAPQAKIDELVKLTKETFGDNAETCLKDLTTFQSDQGEKFMDINKLETYSEKWIDGAIKKVKDSEPF